MSLKVLEEERGEWAVLRVSGELDLVTSPAVRQHVHDAVADGRHSVVLDLSDVLFCDSSGVGVLIASRRLMRSCAGRLRLILPAQGAVDGSHVNRVLAALGVRRLFDCYPDLDAATDRATAAGPLSAQRDDMVQALSNQLDIGADPAEVSRARRWARSRLAAHGIAVDEPLAETIILLISELVTNAVVHADGPAALRLLLPSGAARADAAALRVEVADTSVHAPRPRHAADADTHGRGLELLTRLADRWGWHREGPGKRIWCELDCTP